ncbi:hypothetical protein ACJ5H2_12680 [Nocardioides sp. R1-1]|uniref:hypothetical protein n=1 Tax=Nocardioides sp. R1-1 TaxID=3383502 RepID=UPI0038CFA4CF
MADSPSESLAGRWFDARAIYEDTGWAWTLWAGVKTVVVMFATLGLSLEWYEPKRFYDVLVVRRDDGSTVLRFDYERAEEGTYHLSSLRQRLREEHVFDFCRALGIPIGQVVGPGEEIVDDAEAESIAVPRALRFS